MPSNESRPSLYFGYGSNIWIAQMKLRCPTSPLIGVASLKDWKWIISTRGYANVVPSPGDIVYGLMYELTPDDEASLDRYEGVPFSYGKQILAVDFVSEGETKYNAEKVLDALVYVDELRVKDGKPKEEYIYRMNMAINDGLEHGIPSEYINIYLRPFIPLDVPST